MKKVVLITGAGSGLGKLLAQTLAEKGYIVYGGVREEGNVGQNISSVKLDVTKTKEIKNAVGQIIKKYGRIDVLINNAGLSLSGPVLENSEEEYLNILNINAIGPFRLIKEVLPFMRKQRRGNIINITSLNGIVPLPGFGIYSSSKHALEALGVALRYELLKDNIFVTNVAPGAIFRKDQGSQSRLSHKPAREKFTLLYFILPMVRERQVIDKIIDVIESSRPPVRIVMGRDAKLTFFLQKCLPAFVWDRLMNFVWSKK